MKLHEKQGHLGGSGKRATCNAPTAPCAETHLVPTLSRIHLVATLSRLRQRRSVGDEVFGRSVNDEVFGRSVPTSRRGAAMEGECPHEPPSAVRKDGFRVSLRSTGRGKRLLARGRADARPSPAAVTPPHGQDTHLCTSVLKKPILQNPLRSVRSLRLLP